MEAGAVGVPQEPDRPGREGPAADQLTDLPDQLAALSEALVVETFGGVPNTRTPPEITEAQFDRLLAVTERPGFRLAA